ncbi:tRNA 4-thiouridine(8) synthase ThiI [Candidatus Peregrinibacteria bacterium]|jgi:tRNA uracil 4-sulfurtransferase|nr:tRNA 4-thiouridine(8) synthase ThiI [Candidatus Peregrinibacteria bacterium]
MHILVKFFSEINVKSKPVKKRLTNILCSNLAIALKKIDPEIKVRNAWDKIIIKSPVENKKLKKSLIGKIKKISGIQFFMEVKEYELSDFNSIVEKVLLSHKESLKNKRFCVRCKRSGVHSFSSIDIEKYAGGSLLRKIEGTKVDLHTPEVTVHIEIKDEKFYVIEEKIQGLCGYPVGSQEKILSLLSGGYDSGVSSFLSIKKGCKTDFLFFNLGGHAHEVGVKQLAFFLSNHYSDGYEGKVISIPFEEVVKELLKNVYHKYRGIVLKRCMLKVAEMIANKNNYKALITGESIGQVSSQTLTNLNVITQAINTLVLRPLISYDKEEIISLARKIGTEPFARSMPEYCGVISEKPSTAAKIEKVLHEEVSFNESLLESAYENKRVVSIQEITSDVQSLGEVEVVSTAREEDVIIDIREEEKRKKDPFQHESSETKIIPFFDINKEFPKLDQTKEYLFYCEKGIVSKLHALYLKDKGFKNIQVFIPQS